MSRAADEPSDLPAGCAGVMRQQSGPLLDAAKPRTPVCTSCWWLVTQSYTGSWVCVP